MHTDPAHEKRITTNHYGVTRRPLIQFLTFGAL